MTQIKREVWERERARHRSRGKTSRRSLFCLKYSTEEGTVVVVTLLRVRSSCESKSPKQPPIAKQTATHAGVCVRVLFVCEKDLDVEKQTLSFHK